MNYYHEISIDLIDNVINSLIYFNIKLYKNLINLKISIYQLFWFIASMTEK